MRANALRLARERLNAPRPSFWQEIAEFFSAALSRLGGPFFLGLAVHGALATCNRENDSDENTPDALIFC
jgi:hypothetical protein